MFIPPKPNSINYVYLLLLRMKETVTFLYMFLYLLLLFAIICHYYLEQWFKSTPASFASVKLQIHFQTTWHPRGLPAFGCNNSDRTRIYFSPIGPGNRTKRVSRADVTGNCFAIKSRTGVVGSTISTISTSTACSGRGTIRTNDKTNAD